MLHQGEQHVHGEEYDPSEQEEIEKAFLGLLRMATKDGANKRKAGTKVPWKVDPGHREALLRHLGRTFLDPGGVDDDSKAPHWVAIAWRALALAWQEQHPEERWRLWEELGYGA